MEQGNPNKIDAIIEEIVKNNSIFKLKSTIEQEKEKALMAKSINSAISVLNETGKELVLQDLSVDPDEKFKGFIDSVGNIDIVGITQYTASVVKVKIEEAEREGINLRIDSVNATKENQTISTEDAISMVMISNMILNYENLSNEQKAMLFDENVYNKMSDQDRRLFKEKVYSEASNKNLSENERKDLEKNRREQNLIEAYMDILKENPHLKTYEQILPVFIKKHPEFSEKEISEFCKKYHKEENTAEQNIENIKNNDLRLTKENMVISIRQDYNKLITDGKEKEAEELLLAYKNQIPEIFELWSQMKKNGKFVVWDESEIEDMSRQGADIGAKRFDDLSKAFSQISEKDESVTEEEIYAYEQDLISNQGYRVEIEVDKLIQNEIKILPETLLNSNFKPEQIKKALKIYSSTLKSFNEEEILGLKGITDSQKRYKVLEEFFMEDGIPAEMSEILSKIDYNGQLFNILGDSTKREQFFGQLDQLIEQTKVPQLTDTDVQQGIKQGTIKQEDMIVATEQERTTQESQEVEQENYSFIDTQYLEQDSMEGLIPRNGGNSKAIQDDKTAIFYSQGKEGAIVMYFEFLRQYENLRGERGDKALQKYEAYQNGSIQLTEEQIAQLEDQIKQIKDIRDSQSFDEFMGDKLYLKIDGLDKEEDKKKADEWRAAHPGTKMDYNYANSWTEETIPPDRIDVVTLQRNDGTDTRVSQKDIITYFLSQTSVEKIAELGINDTTLGLIKAYYEEHRSEIAEFGTEYSLVNQDIKEFAQSRENKIQPYGFTERSENEGQEEYIAGKSEALKEEAVHSFQDFLKFSKNEKTSMGDVKDQNDLIVRLANEKVIVPGKVVEEAENDDKGQENI